MDDREWALFAVEFEATFRGDFAEDREAALRVHAGDVPFDIAREAIAVLVRGGQVHMPAPAEFLAALAEVRRARRREQRALEAGPVAAVGTVWKTHEEYDAPRHESLRSDCTGTFKVIEDNGRTPATLECDKCGALLTVRLQPREGPVRKRKRGRREKEPVTEQPETDKSEEWGF